MYLKISETINNLDISSIPDHRLKILNELISTLSAEMKSTHDLKLNFICTHNSRRSHLAQVWAQTLSDHFGLKFQCYSGGTEATAVYPLVINTLKCQGFQIGKLDRLENSLYHLKYDRNTQPIVLFSKVFDDSFNPDDDFLAVMTCSDADENCPIVSGAKKRFALTYEDPKKFDATLEAETKYLERSNQIATELYYIFQGLKTT
jgi:arsenate reductase